jgi:hypothetical protein
MPSFFHHADGFTIISGGQTGADRVALDWAIEKGVPYNGWCPKDRRAEDGVIPTRYRLKETPARNYLQRTEWNVRDSDATVIFSLAGTLTGGSLKTVAFARQHRRPCLHLSAAAHGERAAEMLRDFLRAHDIRTLNVAGPRASKEPEIGRYVRAVLDQAIATA